MCCKLLFWQAHWAKSWSMGEGKRTQAKDQSDAERTSWTDWKPAGE